MELQDKTRRTLKERMGRIWKIMKNVPSLFSYSYFWFKRDLIYSNLLPGKTSLLARLTVTSHVLEKGFTMPDRRLGFGYDRVRALIDDCSLAIKSYGDGYPELQSALDDLHEYQEIHREAGYELPEDIRDGIHSLLSHQKNTPPEGSLMMTKEKFFAPASTFESFARGRHSCRHFSQEKVSLDLLVHCIEVATSSPSACNRQSVRVKIITDPEKMKLALELQKGNRGFGHNIDKLLLLTTDQRYWNMTQRTSGYLDAGLFAMSLLYALHEQKIAACTLSVHMTPKEICKLQKALGTNPAEIPVVFIAVGLPPENFSIARSRRFDTDSVYTVI